MSDPLEEVRGAVAAVARILARAGLVEAFGHVSARLADGFVITATSPLGGASKESVHVLENLGDSSPREGVPLEAALHAAVYLARPDIHAVCRTHSRFVIALGARGQVPPILHGLGGLAGTVAWYEGSDLITEPSHAEAVADALGDCDCLLLRANGAIATGATLAEATVRAWYLEERCRVFADAGFDGRRLDEMELTSRSRWWAAERERAWSWLRWRFREEEGAREQLPSSPCDRGGHPGEVAG